MYASSSPATNEVVASCGANSWAHRASFNPLFSRLPAPPGMLVGSSPATPARCGPSRSGTCRQRASGQLRPAVNPRVPGDDRRASHVSWRLSCRRDGPFFDDLPFELRNGAQNVIQQPPGSRGGVRTLRSTIARDAPLAQHGGDLNEMAQRPAEPIEPIEPPHHSVSPDRSAARVFARTGRAVSAPLPRRPRRRLRGPVHPFAAPLSGRPSRSARSRPDAAGRLGRPGHHPDAANTWGSLWLRFRRFGRCRRPSRSLFGGVDGTAGGVCGEQLVEGNSAI